MALTYDNSFAPGNVYGHSLELLRRLVSKADGTAVHLDVGCGFGAIAPGIEAMGLRYVGVDLDADALKRLKSNGFEAHKVELSDAERTYAALAKVLAGRTVASITILDTLEHVAAPLEIMRALRLIASADNAPIVISVPNVTHTEIAARMVSGKFDYTLDGVLDHTHIVHFSAPTLRRMARQAGLVEVDAFDTKVVESYRNMHLDKDALPVGTSFYSLISLIRGQADNTATSYQLVRAFLPGQEHKDERWYTQPSENPARPLLSIVIRTIGTETFTLRDVLACLAGQSDQDFEILLVGHRLDVKRQIAIEEVLAHQPEFMRRRIRFVQVPDGGRARPLNVGYGMANGRYIVTLDDDDVVFGHYVEVFRKLHEAEPGRLLRARCAVQTARRTHVGPGRQAGISSGPIEAKYPAHFGLLEHLHDNHTPCMSVAYPREIVDTFGMKFDETLTTAEDWDFMMRSYFLVGIAVSPEITSLYRRWVDKPTSMQAHSSKDWQVNREFIIRKLDALPVILSAGVLKELRGFYEEAVSRGVTPANPSSPPLTERQRIKAGIRRRLGRLKALLMRG